MKIVKILWKLETLIKLKNDEGSESNEKKI